MNTKPAPVVQAGAQDVVPRFRALLKHTDPVPGNGEWFEEFWAVRFEDVIAHALFWRQMNTAPVGDPSACIDIWCGQNDCRYVDCYWDRPQEPYGKPAAEPCWVREEYEVGYGFYAVAIANPVAWMPSPSKPEGV